MLKDILLQVQKPARYIGQEWNLPRKEFDKARIKFALCFPDLYEIGMSNLGIRVLYSILNNIPDVVCERFFSPARDMELALRANKMSVFSLESARNLREFDIIGFSLGHELSYTNVLNLLDLGGIPLKSSLRSADHPLIIGGGPCALNPEPMHEFFDLFLIGEAEEAILEIIDVYRRQRETPGAAINRRGLLDGFSRIEGIYVPSMYEASHSPQGKMEGFRAAAGAPLKIKKRVVRDLNSAHFPLDWLVPYIQIVHDRITIEIMRGCPNSCRFCQARSQYFPFRQRKPEKIMELAKETYRRTGYEEISLCGLSVSDFPGLEGLSAGLISFFKEKAVSLSFSSLKPKAMLGKTAELIASIKKTGLTFAPEAATEKMRMILNKDFNTLDFFDILRQAYTAGYQNIKLYFMTGLPFEKEEDLDGIIGLSEQAALARKQTGKGPAQVNISVNTLIPKAHTAFQWFGMDTQEKIKYKQVYLKKRIRVKSLRLNTRNPAMSFLECVLSRGDRRLSEVILSAFNKGARFDAWDNDFSLDRWLDAFRESGIDADFYLQERSADELLPWDFIDIGISKDHLIKEFNKINEAAGAH
ncbi:MAG: TIGR03960 family B12-binding radical SAM protein [Candidatus Omnitrophica bacterium]|nr:TIGR03960 family B12-binding radical SAM protein [Candidatus Omnitrophota bacterium]